MALHGCPQENSSPSFRLQHTQNPPPLLPLRSEASGQSEPLRPGIPEGFLQDAVPEDDPIPGAVIAMQTFGDFLGFNPPAHILVTDGCFYGEKGMFRVAPPLELKKLEAIFRHEVLGMLLNKGKITQEMMRTLSGWKHTGFNVFCGNRISPTDETAMETLARYIIRASFNGSGLERRQIDLRSRPA
jgi:hypothetical protein